ncbi:unnamed protein product, partial [Urochloa humidicola]
MEGLQAILQTNKCLHMEHPNSPKSMMMGFRLSNPLEYCHLLLRICHPQDHMFHALNLLQRQIFMEVHQLAVLINKFLHTL